MSIVMRIVPCDPFGNVMHVDGMSRGVRVRRID